MVTLSEDVWTLKSIRTLAGQAHEHETLDRVIAILEPLAGLSDEQVSALIARALHAARFNTEATDYEKEAHRALAASLTALRGQR